METTASSFKLRANVPEGRKRFPINKEGKPSPAGRYTFATWRLWKKDDALLEAGLLGPVTLHTTAAMNIKP